MDKKKISDNVMEERMRNRRQTEEREIYIERGRERERREKREKYIYREGER